MPNDVFSWNWCCSEESSSCRRGDYAKSGLVFTVFPFSHRTDQEPSRIGRGSQPVLAWSELLTWSQWLHCSETCTATMSATNGEVPCSPPYYLKFLGGAQDADFDPKVDHVDCYKMHACDYESDYSPRCICNKTRFVCLVRAFWASHQCDDLKCVLFRVPFLMFDPKLHVITIGECNRHCGLNLTNVCTPVAMWTLQLVRT